MKQNEQEEKRETASENPDFLEDIYTIPVLYGPPPGFDDCPPAQKEEEKPEKRMDKVCHK